MQVAGHPCRRRPASSRAQWTNAQAFMLKRLRKEPRRRRVR